MRNKKNGLMTSKVNCGYFSGVYGIAGNTNIHEKKYYKIIVIFKSNLYICPCSTSTYKEKIRLSLTKQPLNDLEWTPTILGVLFFNYGFKQNRHKQNTRKEL